MTAILLNLLIIVVVIGAYHGLVEDLQTRAIKRRLNREEKARRKYLKQLLDNQSGQPPLSH